MSEALGSPPPEARAIPIDDVIREGDAVPAEVQGIPQIPANEVERDALEQFPDLPQLSKAAYDSIVQLVNQRVSLHPGEVAAITSLPAEQAEAIFTGLQYRGRVASQPDKYGGFAVIHAKLDGEPQPEVPRSERVVVGEEARTRLGRRLGWMASEFLTQGSQFANHSFVGKRTQPVRRVFANYEYPDQEEDSQQPRNPGIVVMTSPRNNVDYAAAPNKFEAAEKSKQDEIKEIMRKQELDLWEEILDFTAKLKHESAEAGDSLPSITAAELTSFLVRKTGRAKKYTNEAGLDLTKPDGLTDEEKSQWVALTRKAQDELMPFATESFDRLKLHGIILEQGKVKMRAEEITDIRNTYRRERAAKKYDDDKKKEAEQEAQQPDPKAPEGLTAAQEERKREREERQREREERRREWNRTLNTPEGQTAPAPEQKKVPSAQPTQESPYASHPEYGRYFSEDELRSLDNDVEARIRYEVASEKDRQHIDRADQLDKDTFNDIRERERFNTVRNRLGDKAPDGIVAALAAAQRQWHHDQSSPRK